MRSTQLERALTQGDITEEDARQIEELEQAGIKTANQIIDYAMKKVGTGELATFTREIP